MTALRDDERPAHPSRQASGREKVVERLVAWIWERQLLVGPISADDGHAYHVVFRGRTWGERGPDFQGAIVARDDGVLLRGDVEIHVRASDWRKHGHGRDPAYNQTACHVVLWQDEARPTRRQDGVTVPTLELITHLAAPLAELERRMAADRPLDGRLHPAGTRTRPAEAQLRMFDMPVCVPAPEELGALLDRAGLARFHERAAAFEGNLAALAPAEVLYRGVARAMGYTANTAGFERLAEAAPLAVLAEIVADSDAHPSAARAAPVPRGGRHMPDDRPTHTRGSDHAWSDSAAPERFGVGMGYDGPLGRLVTIQAALLGAAGLLPSQRGLVADERWLHALETAWQVARVHLGAPLPSDAWRIWRVRPDNLPARRVAGLSQLVADLLLTTPPTPAAPGFLLADLAEAERARRPARLAERWRVRAADPFWTTHYDVGRPTSGEHAWLVGAGRADEVAVNVLLPFLDALGRASADAALSERVVALYRAYPSTAPNRVTREMARQLGGPRGATVARGACRQQRLIHLYRRWCDAHDCTTCPTRTS